MPTMDCVCPQSDKAVATNLRLVAMQLQTTSRVNPHLVSFEDYRPVFLLLYMRASPHSDGIEFFSDGFTEYESPTIKWF